MQTRLFTGIIAVLLVAMFAAAQDGQQASHAEQFLGTWSGTWEGGGTGSLELTLEKDQGGALAGSVSVTGEPTYTANIRTIAFDGPKMTAHYDFPLDQGIEVVLTATFDDASAQGTWVAVQKSDGSEVARGTWQVSKPSGGTSS